MATRIASGSKFQFLRVLGRALRPLAVRIANTGIMSETRQMKVSRMKRQPVRGGGR